MSLDDVFQNACVKAPMEARNRAEAIDELCLLIAMKQGLGEQSTELAEAVKQRELEGGPEELPGVVIPHARSALIGSPTLAIGKCSRPMDWDEKGARNINLVCLLIVPQSGNPAILVTLLRTMLNNNAVVDRLHRCMTETDFHNFFRRVGVDLDIPVGFSLDRLIGKQADGIQALGWAPQGDALASATAHRDHIIRVWKHDGDLLGELRGHQATILDLAWSWNGELIAAGADDKTARVWRLADRATVQVIHPSTIVHGVAWSPDDRTLALAGHLGVGLWNTKPWRQEKALAGANIVPAFCVRWSPDGDLLAAAGGRGYADVQLWNGHSPKTVARLQRGKEPLVAMAWSPNSQLLVVGDYGGMIYVWDRSNWKTPRKSIQAHGGQITSLSFSHDGAYLASKSEDGTVKLWETREWRKAAMLLDPTTGSLWAPLSFHPDQLRLATLGGLGNSIRIWRISPAELTSAAAGSPAPLVSPPAGPIDVPHALVRAVSDGRAVLFAGAGMSAGWLGVTTTLLMEELAAEISDAFEDYDATDRSFEVVADEYEAVFGREQLVGRISAFIPQARDAAPQHLAAARAFKTIITTNWDLLFEDAYRKTGQGPQIASSNDDVDGFQLDRPTVIKMHGSADIPRTLVATSYQYELYHLTHARLLERIAELLRDKVVLFAGSGLRDEHIRRLVSSIQKSQNTWPKPVYAVGFFDDVRTKLLEHRGIEVIKCDVAVFIPELARRAAAITGL